MNWKHLRCLLQWWPIGRKGRSGVDMKEGIVKKDSISSAVLLLWRWLKPPVPVELEFKTSGCKKIITCPFGRLAAIFLQSLMSNSNSTEKPYFKGYKHTKRQATRQVARSHWNAL